MKKRWGIVLCAAGLAGAAAVAVWLWPEPRGVQSYQGKSIREWARQYSDNTPSAIRSRDAARAAFEALGTNALPELIRLAEADDSYWRKAVWTPRTWVPPSLRKPLLRRVKQPDLFMDRQAAVQVIAIYGPKAQAAIPALVEALGSRQGSLCTDAAFALGRMGKAAVPALVAAAQSRDGWTRRWALLALERLGPQAEAAVQVLINRLEDSEAEVRERAIQALGEIGPAAAAAVPALRRLQQDEKTPAGMRRAAKEALGRIEGVQ